MLDGCDLGLRVDGLFSGFGFAVLCFGWLRFRCVRFGLGGLTVCDLGLFGVYYDCLLFNVINVLFAGCLLYAVCMIIAILVCCMLLL